MEITAKTTKMLAIIKYARLFPFTHQSNFAHRSITKKDGGVVQEAFSDQHTVEVGDTKFTPCL